MQTINAKSKATFTAASVPAVSAASREHKKLADLPKAAEARRVASGPSGRAEKMQNSRGQKG